ncbi:MFS transporter [Aestuariimicrobium sp. p3-SID1156]|uniref:MFS transporter n=1 Tax=Aestuariimicrobium sp. p3-SID1156 TaxID=2916038 RepID=UPI00223A9116|nr:MFS transporter [Aestuariimicrobium sp. p3-SID1156]MCT1459587.1 MFS transporter [Aestuariimicrobium sp. p3-SID1156]
MSRSDRVSMFASFGWYNYRLFWLGALVSNIGGWMSSVAQQWMVLTELTDHSATALGFQTALSFLPVALLAPLTGAVADRFSKRHVLLVTQSLLALNAFGLWLVYTTGLITLPLAFVFGIIGGCVMAFDMPARQAFTSEMVPARLIPNAIGLNSAQFNAARLAGPAVAGLLIAAVGVGPALLINAISFAAVLAGLAAMRPGELTPAPRSRGGAGAVREGLAYVRRRPDILLVMAVVFILSAFGMNFPVTNSLMATTIFGQGAGEFGALGSAMAIGTFAAALVAARRQRPRFRTILFALGGFSLGMIAAGSAPSFPIYMLLLVPIGFCALTILTSCNALVQLAAEPEFRGRVLAVYLAVNMGGTPLGSALIGAICQEWGARAGLWVGGLATALAAVAMGLWLVLHDGVRLRLRRVWPLRFRVHNPGALTVTPTEPGVGAHA